jgi:hypothetical protein
VLTQAILAEISPMTSHREIELRLGEEAASAEASAYAELWRDLPSSDYGMASKRARLEEEGKRKVGSKNQAAGAAMFEV